MNILENLLEWTTTTFSPLGLWGLFMLAFIEASFFPIPPDLLIIILTLTNPSKWALIALFATIGSTLGGMLGYGIGYAGEETILKRFVNKKKIVKVHDLFNRYEAWAIFIAGFTPIPYKVFSISAGVFYINFRKFVIATFISRGLRFFMVAGFIFLWGEATVEFLNTYFNIFTIAATVLAVFGYLVYRHMKKRGVKKHGRKAR